MRRLKRRRKRYAKTKQRFSRHAITAGTAAAISLASQAGLADPSAASMTDAHRVVVGEDGDRDLLTDREEIALGYQPFQNDQDNNGTHDGVDLATRCARAIAELPLDTEVTSPGQIYKKERLQFGQEACDVCGEIVNMGLIEIVDPRLRLHMEVPLLAIHFLEHGALSYFGDIHEGRLDVPKLARALELRFPYEPDNHQLALDYATEPRGQIAPDANDVDGDLLADSEELAAGLNLYDADQDDNLLPDGIQLAQRCAAAIDSLPTVDPTMAEGNGLYKISYMMRGLESCEVCGASVNMGYWQIVNADSGVSIEIPEIARHFMTHGSFSHVGNVHGAGRTEVATLVAVLNLPSACGDLGTVYKPADLNRDCTVDSEDFTEFVEQWLGAAEPTEE
ncbi:MAG: hypothetical protein ACYTAS_08115 [Planctomycetota bacterium]